MSLEMSKEITQLAHHILENRVQEAVEQAVMEYQDHNKGVTVPEIVIDLADDVLTSFIDTCEMDCYVEDQYEILEGLRDD